MKDAGAADLRGGGQAPVADRQLVRAGHPAADHPAAHVETAKVMQSPETRSRFANMGGEATGTTPEEAAAFLRKERERRAQVIRQAGIKVE